MTWYVQTYNNAGEGPWSHGLDYATGGAPNPGRATLLSPLGSGDPQTFVWEQVPAATYYSLYLQDGSGESQPIHDQWYTSAAAACDGTQCPVTVPQTPVGQSYWWVRTWADDGVQGSTGLYGAWSDAGAFGAP